MLGFGLLLVGGIAALSSRDLIGLPRLSGRIRVTQIKEFSYAKQKSNSTFAKGQCMRTAVNFSYIPIGLCKEYCN